MKSQPLKTEFLLPFIDNKLKGKSEINYVTLVDFSPPFHLKFLRNIAHIKSYKSCKNSVRVWLELHVEMRL